MGSSTWALNYKGDRTRQIAVDQWSLKEQMGDNKQNKNASKAKAKQHQSVHLCRMALTM